MHCRNEALITAAGSSKRIGDSIKKEYFFIDNKPALVHSVQAFIKSSEFARIVITIPEGDEDKVKFILSPFIDLSIIQLVSGGKTRQESVYNGLLMMKNAQPDFVLIHDGARPWITSSLILEVLKATKEKRGCIPVVPVTDSLVAIDEKNFLLENLNREKIKAVQTPQGFVYDEILEAHRYAILHNFEGSDDSVLYKKLYQSVFTIPGDINNKKITYKSDLGICG